jgi:hypothetical protein
MLLLHNDHLSTMTAILGSLSLTVLFFGYKIYIKIVFLILVFFIFPQNFTSHGELLYSETDCFQSSYIFDIITKGYKKFNESNFNTIFFARDINGAEVSWGLGFLVNEIMQASVWGKLKKSFISTEIFVCLIIFGIFLMTLSILALKQFCSRYSLLKKMKQRNKI